MIPTKRGREPAKKKGERSTEKRRMRFGIGN